MKTVVYIRAADVYNDSRATKEITALSKNGYKVVVLAWNRSGVAQEKCKEIFKELQNVSFVFYNKPLKSGMGLRKDVFKLISWLRWTAKSLKKIKNADIVHSCDFEGSFGVYKICKKRKIKMVYDIFDYYVDAHSIPSVLKSFIEKRDIRVINNADVTIICNEERRQQIAKATPKRVIVIHNSPSIDKVEKDEITYDYAYCGSLDSGRLVAEILDCYDENSDLRMVFAGHGSSSEKCEELAEKYENFTYLGSIPYSEVLKAENQSKVLSAIYIPTIRNHKLCAPNKFYESLALGKPIIVCEGTGIDNIVKEKHIGCAINYDAKEFYLALRKLIKNEEEMAEVCKISRQLYTEKYSWNIMEKILLDTYAEILN